MYREIQVTRNGILIGGRAETTASDAMNTIRKYLTQQPAGWADGAGWERTGFRTWRSPSGIMRVEAWAR